MKFEQTYQEYFKRIYAYIYARVMSESAADDICSAVWQKVYEKQSSYNSAKGNVSQWLFTIARNEVNSYFRSYYIKHFFSLGEQEESIAAKEKTPIETITLEDDKKRLSAAMGLLDKREKDLIALKFYSSLNNREIAILCSLSESNVGTIISRGLNKIRKVMEAL